MRRSGLAIAVFASLLIPAVPAFAQIAPDDLVITGAAGGYGWDTEIELADSEVGTGVSGSIRVANDILAPCPGPHCPQEFTIPPKGTVRIRSRAARCGSPPRPTGTSGESSRPCTPMAASP